MILDVRNQGNNHNFDKNTYLTQHPKRLDPRYQLFQTINDQNQMGEKSTIMRFLHQVDSMSFCFISSAEQLTVDISGGKFPEGMRGDVDV